MKRLLIAAVTAATAFVAGPALAQPTISVLVLQEDSDPESLIRNNRIQNAVLSEFNQTLNAPAYQSRLAQFGISGMDVYDETAITLDFYQQDRQRRTDQELIALSRQIPNPQLDVIVPYTLYAQATTDPYTGIAKLRMSMSYRALSIRDGRFLGGDNIDLDPAGVPFVGCAADRAGTAADPHCVKEFVSANGERLARNAGNKLAIQLAALMGRAAPAQQSGATLQVVNPAKPNSQQVVVGQNDPSCANLPATFQMTFRGFEQRAITAVEESMAFWNCMMDMNVSDSDFGEITFTYKTRATEQRMLRNIRLMSELLGVVTEARMEGNNAIVVEALGIRQN